jgi:AhpD family alkylhydroperoxidase
MELDSRIQALIAVGAAVSANCQPCLQSAFAMALESGASPREIAGALAVGKRIRKGAASQMDDFALSLNRLSPSTENITIRGCNCSQGIGFLENH